MIYTTLDTFYLSHEQILDSPSRRDGVDENVESLLRVYGCELIQECGILLKLYFISFPFSFSKPCFYILVQVLERFCLFLQFGLAMIHIIIMAEMLMSVILLLFFFSFSHRCFLGDLMCYIALFILQIHRF
jgi:hypothetical protein